MPDYIYLLENRLSQTQRHALQQLREVVREAGLILFLTGNAVRDLTSGHTVRALEVSVHGNPLKLKKNIEKAGGKIWGEHVPSQSLYLCFPGSVRVDLVSAHSVSYPKPGKPVYHPASILEDLQRRDFTVNAMAISLNEGSFGLLMDPLNGVADIESRTLRLVSNYGFIEDPSLLIRATRYRSRMGWEMDPRTQARYDNAKADGVIEYLTPHALSLELEQIGHEDDGLTVLRALEAEGWMKVLFPAWASAKADEAKLQSLHELAAELFVQGVQADISVAQMQLLTAKMSSKEVAALKSALLRPGFVEEWNQLDSSAAAFAKILLAKENSAPSSTFKLFTSYDPEAILWLGFTSKSAPVQERYRLFLKEWPEIRQRIPYVQMQEMRITPELPNYTEIAHQVFLELLDGRLSTPEEMQAYLEPFSPPAPPPPVTVKRTRAKKNAGAKLKAHVHRDEEDEELADDQDLDDLVGDDKDDLDLSKEDLDTGFDEEEEDLEEPDEIADEQPKKKQEKSAAKPAAEKVKPASTPKPEKVKVSTKSKAVPAPAQKPAAKPAAKPAPSKPVHKSNAAQKAKPEPKVSKTAAVAKSKGKALAKKAPVPHATAKKPVAQPKHVAAKPVGKAAAKSAKTASKPVAKPAAKAVAKQVKKTVVAKSKTGKAQAKPAAKKAAPKHGKKR